MGANMLISLLQIRLFLVSIQGLLTALFIFCSVSHPQYWLDFAPSASPYILSWLPASGVLKKRSLALCMAFSFFILTFIKFLIVPILLFLPHPSLAGLTSVSLPCQQCHSTFSKNIIMLNWDATLYVKSSQEYYASLLQQPFFTCCWLNLT